jgi:DNA-binding response OmpR family regulator
MAFTQKGLVLIVEDEEPIRLLVRLNLEQAGFDVQEAATGEEALAKIEKAVPDLVILDLRLPDIDGYTVCRHLRDHYPKVAIIMLTALSQDYDKVLGLELGADDYLVKPFNPLELIARVRAVLRRLHTVEGKEVPLTAGDLTLFPAAHEVRKKGRPLELTPREFSLLKTLMANPGRVFTRDELLDAVWGEDFLGDRKTVDVHIRRLRAKLGQTPSSAEYIETVWGVGYRFRKEQP